VANADALAKTTLERLRADPGANAVVLGSYTVLPGKGENGIRLDIRVQDTSMRLIRFGGRFSYAA
jgi:hypothetical protein